jgi:hypothetical protein
VKWLVYGPYYQDSIFGKGKDVFPDHRVQTGSGAYPASYPMGVGGGGYSPGANRQGFEADHSSPCSTEATSIPPIRLHGVVLSYLQHRLARSFALGATFQSFHGKTWSSLNGQVVWQFAQCGPWGHGDSTHELGQFRPLPGALRDFFWICCSDRCHRRRKWPAHWPIANNDPPTHVHRQSVTCAQFPNPDPYSATTRLPATNGHQATDNCKCSVSIRSSKWELAKRCKPLQR